MNRYAQPKNKKPFLLIVICLLILFIPLTLFYQNNKQVAESKQELLVIPAEQEPSKQDASLVEQSASAITMGGASQLAATAILESSALPATQTEKIEPALELDLATSDAPFKVALAGLSEPLVGWFASKARIKKFVVLVNDVSQLQLPYKSRKFLKMPQQMKIERNADDVFIAQASYRRYDFFSNTIAAIDTQQAVALYTKFRPLFKQAYATFSYPENYQLEDIFVKALAAIIQAPVMEQRIKLVRHTVNYKFADERLEAMNAVNKQMLRMGPANTRKIQTKARQLAKAMAAMRK